MARVTLEALSAHGIHSGQGDYTHDVLLVRDANGLPALPGSTLAGVLRHMYAARHGQATADTLFGCIGDGAQPSWLTVAWAHVHDSNDRPVPEGIAGCEDDVLLSYLQNDKPLVRQRVRLNHRGAATDAGKFDQTLIPSGVRYTGWLGYWCNGTEESDQAWQQLLSLLTHQRLRLGHGTRSGTGLFQTAALASGSWDLRKPEGRRGYVKRPRSRSSSAGLEPLELAYTPGLEVTMELHAESAWRVGGGERSLFAHDKAPDLLPQHETRIAWTATGAQLNHSWHLLPGSAIKGALRHRVAYHYRCLTGDFAGHGTSPAPEDCLAVQSLFGFSEGDNGQAGILAIDDLYMAPAEHGVLMHNRIDRFTGGVINGALFSEEILWRSPLRFRLEVIDSHRHGEVDKAMRAALQRTLADLACGWLPLGAGGSRGLGVMLDESGTGPVWSDGGAWISGSSPGDTA
jgi:CRISPR/Cas system CMR subunit Cmr4 (Cas7 group RAMP superfamily)